MAEPLTIEELLEMLGVPGGTSRRAREISRRMIPEPGPMAKMPDNPLDAALLPVKATYDEPSAQLLSALGVDVGMAGKLPKVLTQFTRPAQPIKLKAPATDVFDAIDQIIMPSPSSSVKLRPLDVLARWGKQKGLDKIPTEWIEGVERYVAENRRFEMLPYASWGPVVKPYNPAGSPRGTVRFFKGGGAPMEPDALVHEIAHEGFQRIFPAERTLFMQEFAQNVPAYSARYGMGRNIQARHLASLPPDHMRRQLEKGGNELFAMAVAEKATRTKRQDVYKRLLNEYGIYFKESDPGVYGLISPEARKVIDKYVRTLVPVMGAAGIAGGMANEDF